MWRAAERTRARESLNLCVLPVHEREEMGGCAATDPQQGVERVLSTVKGIDSFPLTKAEVPGHRYFP